MIDLTETLFAQRAKPRGDEDLAHVADIYGCDRATWYRRNGHKPAPFTREKLAQFAIGHAYEREVVETLRLALDDKIVAHGGSVEIYGLVGHPDITIYDDAYDPDKHDGKPTPEFVIEVKTTELRAPKSEVSPHYAVQASAYALAQGAPKAVVLVKHAGSHVETTYEVNPEGYRGIIARRAAEVIARTGRNSPIPQAEPGDLAPWGCRYCDFAQCYRNPKYASPADDLDDEVPFKKAVAK